MLASIHQSIGSCAGRLLNGSRPMGQMGRHAPCKRAMTRFDSVDRAPHLRRGNPAPGLRILAGTFDSSRRCQTMNAGLAEWLRPRSTKPLTRVRFSRPAPASMTRGVTAAQRILNPSGLRSNRSGSTTFSAMAEQARQRTVNAFDAGPNPARGASFPPGMKVPRTAHPGLAGDGHVCEAAVRRRLAAAAGKFLPGCSSDGRAPASEAGGR